jgi:Tol biopolymer transport system component
MPDVQEVFRMATQKVRPDPGALDRQLGRQRRSKGGRKVGAFAVAASFIAIAVAVFALTRSSGESTQVATRPPAVPVPTTTGLYTVNVATGTLQSFPDPGGSGFTTSPDGSTIAFQNDVDGSAQVFVMNADGSAVRQLTDDRYGADSPAWSPDGSELVYVGFGNGAPARRNLFVLDLDTGTSTRVTNLQSEPFQPSWSSDGQLAYTLLGEPRIRLIDPASGRGSTLLTARDQAWDAQWSPDGTQVAYIAETPDPRVNEIWIMNADGSGKRALLESHNLGISPVWSADGSKIVYVDDENGGVRTFAVDPETGASTPLTWGWAETWIGPDTLLVGFSPEDIAAASGS